MFVPTVICMRTDLKPELWPFKHPGDFRSAGYHFYLIDEITPISFSRPFAEISFSVGRWTTHIKAVIRRRRFSVILIKLIRELLLVELPECGKRVSFFSRLTESVNKTPSGMLYTVLYLCEVISPPGVFPGTSTKSESRIQEVNWAWRIYCFKPFSLACKARWTTVWGTLSWICISSLLVL